MNQSPNKKDRWFVCPQPNPGADLRLFLFPYAGGTPAAFSGWSDMFPANIETCIVHYPGRGSRFNEAPIKGFSVLVQEIAQVILPLLDKPSIFFGHSMGGIVAFELARNLLHQSLPQPQILFVSACGAPHLPNPNPPIHSLPGPEFIKSLQELNGISAEVANHSELMELLLPSLCADFEAIENYKYISSERQLSCPIIAFGGTNDSRVQREFLEDWAEQTSASFKSQYFSGDHFFINTMHHSVVNSMIAEMAYLHATK